MTVAMVMNMEKHSLYGKRLDAHRIVCRSLYWMDSAMISINIWEWVSTHILEDFKRHLIVSKSGFVV